MVSEALLIFVRFPHPGKVKTRLAQSLGKERAAEFYYLCADAVIREAGRLAGKVELYVVGADEADEVKIKNWAGPAFNFIVQDGETLGQRLENAFNTAFQNGALKAVVAASDVPDLSTDILKEALKSLDENDTVIGPCFDGGYYLIGMKQLYKELFQGISWSTERVYGQTVAAIKENNLSLYQLQTLIDIDSETDLHEWAKTDNGQQPVLSEFLKTIGLKPILRR